MKPVKLEISAFGPYKDKVEIDFSKIGECGIFLITGDTGAGKTTIFDSIVFALFGEVSGSNRQVSSIRSNFSDAENDTYVNFKFNHKGKDYEVKRIPQYERPKKSGEGFTKNAPDAYIEFDDKVISGINNVNEKVEEVLGINAKQFKQISMLAQGEFLKILFAESKDRTEIFRKIFDTDIYNNITNILRNKRRESEDKLASLKTSFVTNTKNIIWNNDENLENKIDEKDLNPVDVNEILERLELDIKQKKEQEQEVEKNVVKAENEYKKTENEYIKIEEENKKIDRYNLLLQRGIELKEKEKYYKNEEKLLDINQKIKEKVNPIEQTLNSYKDNLKNLNGLYKSERKKYEELKFNEKTIQEKECKIKDLKLSFENYQKYNKDLEDIRKVLDKLSDIDKINEEKDNLVKKYNMVNKEYKEISNKYIEEEDKFFKEQAGILAEKLKGNMPCPVCGSTAHPNIAKKSHIVLSKQDLDNLKEKRENKLKENDNIKDQITEVSAKVNTLIKELNIENKEIIGYKEKLDSQKEEIITNINNIKQIVINLYEDIAENKFCIEEFSYDEFKEEFDRKRKIQVEEITKSSTLIDQYYMNIKNKEKEVKDLENEYRASYNKLGFDTYEEYIKNVLEEDEVKEKQESIKEYNAELVENKTKMKELSKLIKNKGKIDVTECKNSLDEKLKILKEVKDKQIKVKGILENNKKIQVLLKANSNELLKQIEIFLNIDELYKTASGNLSGKRRIEFEQYVQATYFDMIIFEANKRLIKMTDNRYILKRKESSDKIKEKIGLDLEVIDNYNGKTRDVKSLSGGESFKAALALSLGVSDIIQSYSGGIVIDTLFIDEGFGTLDTESREQAINTLSLLTDNNKLIGIISHVTELKERVDKKIIVEKTHEGSRIRLEI